MVAMEMLIIIENGGRQINETLRISILISNGRFSYESRSQFDQFLLSLQRAAICYGVGSFIWSKLGLSSLPRLK